MTGLDSDRGAICFMAAGMVSREGGASLIAAFDYSVVFRAELGVWEGGNSAEGVWAICKSSPLRWLGNPTAYGNHGPVLPSASVLREYVK